MATDPTVTAIESVDDALQVHFLASIDPSTTPISFTLIEPQVPPQGEADWYQYYIEEFRLQAVPDDNGPEPSFAFLDLELSYDDGENTRYYDSVRVSRQQASYSNHYRIPMEVNASGGVTLTLRATFDLDVAPGSEIEGFLRLYRVRAGTYTTGAAYTEVEAP